MSSTLLLYASIFKMQFLRPTIKTKSLSHLINLLLISSSVCIVFLLVSLFLVSSSRTSDLFFSSSHDMYAPASLEHIVFGIASNKNSWPKRKEYAKLWWRPEKMRGCVFLESLPSDTDSKSNDNSSLPPLCISEDTSRFRYTYRGGQRSAIRVARVVVETVALNHSDVQWYVFGDDDTVFFPDNLVKTLSKYDPGLWYYIGSNSEDHEQNRIFSFQMAFGGAGFAMSASLANVLAKVFDSCIERYPHLYGSDSRIYSCLAELGVSLTLEPGFHQFDVRGNLFGLLASHPTAPLVSVHHLYNMGPIFPNLTRVKALEHLFEAANVDPGRILQQTVCYDRWFSWTISVSWGYAVQVFGRHIHLPDILPVQETFQQWKKGNTPPDYTFNTRELHPDPCQRPTIFFLDNVTSGRDGIRTSYRKSFVNCSHDMASPRKIEEIRVLSHKLDLHLTKLQAPRRHCCDVLPSSAGQIMDIAIRECKEEELIHMH